MPQLGETVTEGTIVRWLKQEGDDIGADEALFDVSTDKVDAEVPSAYAGVVRALLVAEGETVPIGTAVALIGQSADEPLPDEVGAGPAGQEATSTSEADRQPRPGRPGRPGRPARERGNGSAPGPSDGAVADGSERSLSPVVKSLLDEHALTPGDVVGSGRDGRVTRADVLAAAAYRDRGPGARPAAGTSPPPVTVAVAGPDDDVVPFSRSRRNTAVAMSASKATAAHALVTTEVDYVGVDAVRRGAGLTYLPFVARSMIDALRCVPEPQRVDRRRLPRSCTARSTSAWPSTSTTRCWSCPWSATRATGA